jgi:Skp family chaperone for outer membrane proteins
MIMNKRFLALAMVSSSLFIGQALAETTPAANTKTPTKDESKKANAAAVNRDVNANITVGDVVANPSVKVDLSVRYINTMEAMQSCEKGVKISQELEKKRQELSDVIKKEEQKITKVVTEFKSKESTMSVAARNNEEAKAIKMRREYETLVKSSEDELKLAMQQATEELSVEMEKAVAELAKKNKWDVVADIYTGRALYVSNKAMITQDLVQELDKKYEGAKKPASKTVTA